MWLNVRPHNRRGTKQLQKRQAEKEYINTYLRRHSKERREQGLSDDFDDVVQDEERNPGKVTMAPQLVQEFKGFNCVAFKFIRFPTL